MFLANNDLLVCIVTICVMCVSFKYYSISVSMHLVQSVLHVVQVGYAYILMLIVMSFNAWLFLAVIFGAGVGYLLFAKSRHLMGNFREQNEHCH